MDIKYQSFPVEAVIQKLSGQDDPDLWKVAMAVLTDDFVRRYDQERGRQNWLFIVGACSHWVRPHQSLWRAAGGFAYPEGYRNSLPEFDWFLIHQLKDRCWIPLTKASGKSQTILRAAIPTRTTKHKQAAVHAKWSNMDNPVLYGFRNVDRYWKCVAASDEQLNGCV